MWHKLLDVLLRLIPGSNRFRFLYNYRRIQRKLKFNRYQLKKLSAVDPQDPRVRLGDYHYIGPDPMSLSPESAQELLDLFARAEAEITDMEAQRAAGVANPQPRPTEVESILHERSQSPT